MSDDGGTADPYEGLRTKLAESQSWPGDYTFKFIVPEEQLEPLKVVFEGREISTRPSKTGKYISLTSTVRMDSSTAVIDLYRETEGIPGLIAL